MLSHVPKLLSINPWHLSPTALPSSALLIHVRYQERTAVPTAGFSAEATTFAESVRVESGFGALQ